MKKIISLSLCFLLCSSLVSNSHLCANAENKDQVKMLDLTRQDNIIFLNHSKTRISKGELSGEMNLCIFAAEFNNVRLAAETKSFEDSLINNNFSINTFYKVQSDGKFELKSDKVFGKHLLKEGWKHYLSSEERLISIWDEVLDLSKDENEDTSLYDKNGDGVPDLLMIIVPSKLEVVETVEGNRKTITTYMFPRTIISDDGGNFCIFQPTDFSNANITTMDTLFFLNLILGFIPLVDYNTFDFHVGAWDIMAGFSNVKGSPGLCAFSKYQLGWIDEIKTIEKAGQYEIDALCGNGSNKAYKIPIPGSQEEYLIIENRYRINGDALLKGIPAEGILIYHFRDNKEKDSYFNTTTKEDPYPGLKLLDRSQTGTVLWLDNYAFKYGANFSEDAKRTSIDATTTVNTLPYGKKAVRETITIYDISKSGPKMTFKLRYDKPTVPIVNVDETMPFAKVEKGTTKTMKLNFRNIGSGNIKIFLKPSVPWITVDRTNFIGTDEDINVTVDPKTLKYGTNIGYIIYSGTSEGQVRVTVDVSPITGDINIDSSVDDLDVELLRLHLGDNKSQITFDRVYDLDKNGEVNGGDLIALAKNYKTRFWSFLLPTK